MKKRQYSTLWFLFLGLTFLACERPETIVETDKDEYEVEDHIIIGRTMQSQIDSMPKVFNVLDKVEYKEAYGYMTQLLNSLKLTSVVKHRRNFDWDVTILHDDNIRNAFTLPGGHIYIYTGLLKFITAEHELMAVLGHEIAYADKELTTIALWEEHGGVLLGDIILGKEVAELGKIVEGIPSMKYTEDKIMTADNFAIELICPFQYDITGLGDFIQRANGNRIEWIESKKCDIEKRLIHLEEITKPCGEEGVTNIQQYQRKIKNYLPTG